MDVPLGLDAREGIGVHQRRKLVELRNEYALTDAAGTVVGSVTQERQSGTVKVLRMMSDLDVALPIELDVFDGAGAKVLEIVKPAMTWRCSVRAGHGEVGTISKKVRLGRARFLLADSAGVDVGRVDATGWRAREFAIVDPQGQPFAHVTKRWRGLVTEAFTDADSYAVEFAPHATATQRVLAFASALAVDLVMKQKDG